MKFKVKFSGSKKIDKHFEKFRKELDKVVDENLINKAKEITAEAKRKAPVDMGFLQTGIKWKQTDEHEYTVTSEAYYSAFMEFGTGKKVDPPAEWHDIALKFKGGGRADGKNDFDSGLKSIEEWCMRVGIDPENAYFIFMNILKEGLEPHPFMHPAFVHGRKTYKKDMENEIQFLIKKYNE